MKTKNEMIMKTPDKKNTPAPVSAHLPVLPDNLSTWVSPMGLVGQALKSLEACGAAGPSPNFETAAGSFRPPMLLTLLSCAYVSGLHGSRDIESVLSHDRTLRYVCAGTFPDEPTLRLFRRQNREALRRCLAGLLERLWASRYSLQGAPDFMALAEQRISLAVMLDSAVSDE